MSIASQFFGGGSRAPLTATVAEFLLVGGGAGGGGAGTPNNYYGGGGGAGQVTYIEKYVVEHGDTYTIDIGAGGSGGPGTVPAPPGTNGDPSSFSGPINSFTAIGGGGGGWGTSGTVPNGVPGGSGGGAGSGTETSGGAGIAIVSTVFILFSTIYTRFKELGNTGGSNLGTASGGGGGGGATQAGFPAPNGSGGVGFASDITGSTVVYGNGGSSGVPGNGTASTGNGGNGFSNGGNGGSGIFVVRWPTAYRDAISVTGNSPTPAQPGYYVYRFDGPGSITF